MIAREQTPLERRAAAAQKLLNAWRDRPFSWAEGVTCVRLCAAHLREMGYRPPLAKAGRYKTPLGARRALARAGFATLADGLDAMGLARIAPAAAIVGDIIELPGEAPFNALAVALGNGRVLGFHQDLEGAGVLQPSIYVTAWRVEPRG